MTPGWGGLKEQLCWVLLSCLSLPEPAVSLEQCEQLVAELQGSVRQAVQLYHLVRVGYPPAGRQSRSGVLAEYLEHNDKALPPMGGWSN